MYKNPDKMFKKKKPKPKEFPKDYRNCYYITFPKIIQFKYV